MASRQEEKEARKRERLEQEERERKASTRSKRVQYVIGGVLAVGIVAAVVVALLASGGGDDGATSPTDVTTSAKLPEPAILDEDEAAKAADCTITQVPDEGREHEEKDFTAADYSSNPPTSGTHYPVPAQDGIYEPANTPQVGELVHALEHGRINVQYGPDTDPAYVDKLAAFLGENQGYHMLLYENSTGMDAAIAATAWDVKLECPSATDKVFDALRTFRDAHIDRGPEKVA